MSIDIDNPLEFSPTAANRAEVKERLRSIELSPEQMFELATGIVSGAELLGTNLTVEVLKKKTNPEKFSIDFKAVPEESSDGPLHSGYAKLFVPSEGTRTLLDTEHGGDFLGTLVGQWLKLHRKGFLTLGADETVETKAGELGADAADRLDRATSSIVWEFTERLAAEKAGVSGYVSDLANRRTEQVAAWLGDDSVEEARVVFDDILNSTYTVLSGVMAEEH